MRLGIGIGIGFRPAVGGGAGAPNFYADSVNGSDSNDGLAQGSAFATLPYAISVAGANEIIGVARPGSYEGGEGMTESLVSYGSSGVATVSGDQSLSGKSWVSIGSGVYETTFSLPAVHIPAGSGGNTATTYPFVRYGETWGQWQVGGADIAANQAALAASTGVLAFELHVTGSTVQDIRDDTAATNFTLRVKMPDGSDPTGLDIRTMKKQNIDKFQGALVEGVTVRGAWSKDSVGGSPTPLMTVRDVISLDGGCHGWVGPANLIRFKAISRPRPGMNNYSSNRTPGGGVVLYTGTARTDEVISINGLWLEDFGNGLYGHGTGTNSLYKRIDVGPSSDPAFPDFRLRNIGDGCKLDKQTSGAVLIEGIRCTAQLDWEGIFSNAFNMESRWEFTGGGSIQFASSGSTRQVIGGLATADASLLLGNTSVSSLKTNVVGFQLLLYRVTGSPATPPTVEFSGCTLPIPAANAFQIPTVAAEADAHLILSNGTITGDLIRSGGTSYPASLTVGDGCTFGFADQTSRAAVRALLDGAGKTHNISDNTTLLRRDGSVAEAPDDGAPPPPPHDLTFGSEPLTYGGETLTYGAS